MDLLEKVGELVEKLFDLDEELIKSWIIAQPSEEEDGESSLDVASCLLEAAKQLRCVSEILIQENVSCIFMPMFIFIGNKKNFHGKSEKKLFSKFMCINCWEFVTMKISYII